MVNLSRRSHSLLTAAGFFLAVSGWVVAWKNARARDEAIAGQSSGDAGRPGKSSFRDGRSGKEAPLASDPRTVRLMQLMAGMDGQVEPGKPNPKFIQAAEATLNDSLFHRRQRDFRLLMEKMRPEDAQAIHEHFKSLEREGRYFGDEYGAFAMRWGQVDGAGAMAYWSAREPFDLGHGDMVNLVTGWATADPEKAAAWVEGNQDLLGNMNAYTPLVVGWINTDPVAATAWLRNQKLGTERTTACVNGAMLDKIYSDGLEGASEWLASLPDDDPDFAMASKIGWMGNVERLRNLDPGQAAAAWTKVGSEPWIGAEDFQRFCNSVAGANSGSLEGFVEELASRWPAKEAAARFGSWTVQDPALVGALLEGMPASEFRSAGINGMLDQLERTDAGLAETWRSRFAE